MREEQQVNDYERPGFKFLIRVRDIQSEIDALRLAKERAEADAMRTVASLTGMPSSPSKDPHKFDNIADLAKQIDDLIDDKYQTMSDVLAVIRSIEVRRYRVMLIEYFINGRTWEAAAEQVGISDRHLRRIKAEAYAAVEEHLPLDKEN